ncbi:MAG TPA: ABC transporter ATP-binding protein [Pyrinomonadaceae bacterium]|nr:ABC transporter ATP-binding protein [Pyrinomonadaceae bacterium]
MPLLSLQNISKSYGATPAVTDLTLAVERGEFFGLLGPSGCGKTTTLRMIAGLEKPDAGKIEFDGADITARSPERRGFGMVFQNYALFPHLNVFENVAFGLRARRRPRAEVSDRVTHALGLVQLPGYERRRVDELSGGQQQRVAIARAISIEPALLLFDEPLSNLDVALREETREELRELVARLGLTAVYVTHDQEEAFALCDRISVMGAGRILQTGAPRELYERPTQVVVARFLGRNNLISARRLSPQDETPARFITIDGGHTLSVSTKRRDSTPLDKNCTLAIRPEHLSLGPASADDETKGAANVLRATVRAINFNGATTSVRLDAGGLMLEALLLRPDDLAVGDACRVGLPAERINVLSSEAEGGSRP